MRQRIDSSFGCRIGFAIGLTHQIACRTDVDDASIGVGRLECATMYRQPARGDKGRTQIGRSRSSNCSMLHSVRGVKRLTPALLMITSISPHSSKSCCMPCSKAAASRRSIGRKRVPVCKAVSFPCVSSISQKVTRCPALRNRRTMAYPMPLAPPVTKTRRVL